MALSQAANIGPRQMEDQRPLEPRLGSSSARSMDRGNPGCLRHGRRRGEIGLENFHGDLVVCATGSCERIPATPSICVSNQFSHLGIVSEMVVSLENEDPSLRSRRVSCSSQVGYASASRFSRDYARSSVSRRVETPSAYDASSGRAQNSLSGATSG